MKKCWTKEMDTETIVEGCRRMARHRKGKEVSILSKKLPDQQDRLSGPAHSTTSMEIIAYGKALPAAHGTGKMSRNLV